MSDPRPRSIRWQAAVLSLWATLGFPLPALAASAGEWRSTYDVVMMWVNFVILAALLVKFLRKPLGRFLTSQRDEIKKTFDILEAEKNRLHNDVRALREALQTRRQIAADRHRRILEQARKERLEIIETAREEAQRRLLKARQQIDARQREAYLKLRSEIIDAALGKVLEDLPEQMTVELEEDLTKRFLTSISTSKH